MHFWWPLFVVFLKLVGSSNEDKTFGTLDNKDIFNCVLRMFYCETENEDNLLDETQMLKMVECFRVVNCPPASRARNILDTRIMVMNLLMIDLEKQHMISTATRVKVELYQVLSAICLLIAFCSSNLW